MRRNFKKLLSAVLASFTLVASLPMNGLEVQAAEVQGEVDIPGIVEASVSSITEEQLFMLAPTYLHSEPYDQILTRCSDLSREAMNTVSTFDEVMAAFMHGLQQGSSVIWQEIWSNCGMETGMYDEFKEKAAKELVFEYMETSPNLTKAANKIGDDFGPIDTTYDLMSEAGKEVFKENFIKNDLLISEKEAEQLADSLFENSDKWMGYVDEGAELVVLAATLMEMQMIEIQAIDDLIVIHNQIKDTTMRDALVQLRYEITTDIGTYFVQNYLKDKVLELIQKEVKTAANNLVADKLPVSGLASLAGKFIVKTVAWAYELEKPSVSDIVYSQILYQYWNDSYMAAEHYKYLFLCGEGTEEDIRLYEAAMNFNAACTRLWLKKSMNLVKDEDSALYRRMENWVDVELNYDLYLNNCLRNANQAIADGTLVIEEDSATITDKNGTVIDENYDSTESIKARFQAIQNQFVPNVGQTWESDWGGAIQCFGFARMVFYKLYDCNMPAQYVGGAKYKFATEDNVVTVGQLVGDNVTASNAKALLQQGKLGDIIQASGATYGQHTMVFVSADDSGVTVYDCNAQLNNAAPCTIHQWTISWATWESWYGTGTANDVNGISLYRAANYAQVYGDGDGLFYDDSVNFVIQDGVLTKYNGWQAIVEIPEGVTSIGSNAFKNNTTMYSVSIPDGVTSIGSSAFYGCSSLLGVEMPDSVEVIRIGAFSGCIRLSAVKLSEGLRQVGENVFYNCDSLIEIEIPKSLVDVYDEYDSVYIPEGAFNQCSNLKRVRFAEGSTVIADSLFRGCDGLEEIVIPTSITEIKSSAFSNCINLVSVQISNSVTSIGKSAFLGCTGLETIEIPGSVEVIRIGAFSGCSRLSVIKLSEGLRQVGENAFYNCDSLIEIEIPKSLVDVYDEYDSTYTPEGAFNQCSNLKKVVFAEGSTVVADSLLRGCDGLEEIVIPATITGIKGSAFSNCINLVSVQISDSVTSIGSSAFYGCTKLSTIKIPTSVTSIGSSAFATCTGLETIEIPGSVEVIGIGAFSGCTRLSAVKLSEGLRQVGENVFYNCDSLTEIEIPKSLVDVYDEYDAIYTPTGAFNACSKLKEIRFAEGSTVVADSLFWGCDGLEQVIMPSTITAINSYAFYNCTNLKNIEIPDSVTSMGTYVFAGCTNLESVRLPKGRINIAESTFRNCTSLATIEFPDSVQYIRAYAFENSGLTELELPENLLGIEQNAFYNCDTLTTVDIPTSVTSIGNNVFYDCDALETVTIPNSVTSLGTYVFYSCDELQDVTMGLGLTNIPTYTFSDCGKLASVVIPYNVTTIKDYAFRNCTSLTEITIPQKTTTISSNAFSYPTKMTAYGVAGTYAETYANEQGMTFVDRSVPATSVTLSQESYTVNRNSTIKLIPTITPANFTDLISFKSSDTSIATVDANGNVKGLAVGTTTIKVTVGNVSTSCKITVTQPVTSIGLNKTSLSLKALETYNLTATVYPADANNRTVQWTSSDENIATVSDTGLVTALSKGSCTITAAAMDGSGVTRACTVTVTNSAYIVEEIADFQSSHPYESNNTDIWKYTLEGAECLAVTFDADTCMEDGFDYLYILDGEGNQIGEYTGDELSEQTIELEGDTVCIQLKTDSDSNEYGFRVVSVTETEVEEDVTEIFNDIPSNAWYVAAVQFAYDNNIMAGSGESFKPADPLTREQFVQVLYGNEGKPSVEGLTHSFTDVKNAWYTNAVLWANDKGIAAGNADGTFGIAKNITREQLALMLYNYAKLKSFDLNITEGQINQFADGAKVSSYAREALNWAITQGIISGKGTAGADISTFRIDPQGTATRAECAAMMRMLLVNNETNTN